MLRNPKYRGERIWNRTGNRTNPDAQAHEKFEKPQEEWLRVQRDDLRIVSDELWEAARRREEEVSRDTRTGKGKHQPRTESYPKAPFQLRCGYCNHRLYNYRSGKNASVHCPKGKYKRDGCKLSSAKTLRIIEESMIARLRQLLLDESDYDQMFADANAFIAAEAAKPSVDIAGLDNEIKNLSARIKRIRDRLVQADAAALDGLIDVVGVLEAKRESKIQERNAARRTSEGLRPLDKKAFAGLIGNLRALLYDDVQASAEVLGKVCGPIRCWQGEKASKGYKWIARMEIDPTPILIEMAKKTDCPTTTTLEFLHGRSWTKYPEAEVALDFISNERRIGGKVKEMRAAGASINQIVQALESDPKTIEKALKLEESELVAYLAPRDYSYRKNLPMSKAEKLRPEVVRLYENENMTLSAIAKKLGLSESVVHRSYRRQYKQREVECARQGRKRKMKPRSRLPREKTDLIAQRLRARLRNGGKSPSDRAIAREAGVSKCVVHKARKALEAEQESQPGSPSRVKATRRRNRRPRGS